jgi:hypothetical protein
MESSADPWVQVNNMLRVGVLWIVLAFFSGCAEPGHLVAPLPSAGAINSIQLTDCAGGLARIDAPEPLLAAPTPPTWQTQNGLPTTVTMIAVTCGHLSLGTFERGPIHLVAESHEKFNAPDNCRAGDYTYLNVLTRMIWSDPEVAAAVQNELGIPTSVGTISIEETGTEIAGTKTVRWTVADQESSFTVGHLQNDETAPKSTFRYVWANGPNLGLIDFHWDSRESWLEPTATYGEF